MNESLFFFIIVIAVIITGFFIIFRVIKKKIEPKDAQSFVLLQNQIQELNRTLDSKMGESSRFMQFQHGESAKLIRDVTERLTKLDETNRQVVNFADQLQSLQDILKNPKQRGVLGEYYLETLLKNVLPTGSYEVQYHMGMDEKTGKELIVDAVVFVKDKIIPIDSKFSLENYNRLAEERDPAERERLEKLFRNDLKNRIDETAKYVRPTKGTMDFAFMFIPHEAIYYDLLVAQVGAVKVNTRDLIEYAFKEKHVIIVSPTSFLAYLQTVLQGLKALQIEESAKDIIKRVEELGRHVASYESYLQKLGNHLGTSVSTYNLAYKEFAKIDKDVTRVTGIVSKVEPITLESPTHREEE
ncbi:MAG: DNA recombination protein RmuC [bacterium]|nr:DNA recombination protein RmuC [Candidatus Jorgensenbacteria bacterium]